MPLFCQWSILVLTGGQALIPILFCTKTFTMFQELFDLNMKVLGYWIMVGRRKVSYVLWWIIFSRSICESIELFALFGNVIDCSSCIKSSSISIALLSNCEDAPIIDWCQQNKYLLFKWESTSCEMSWKYFKANKALFCPFSLTWDSRYG